jgi:hypothetical protein
MDLDYDFLKKNIVYKKYKRDNKIAIRVDFIKV